MAPSNIKYGIKEAGNAAEDKTRRKENKYRSLIDQNYHFAPFAVETIGPWCAEAKTFFNELSKMISIKTNESTTKYFLKQTISMAMRKGNATSVMGTFLPSENMEEIFFLL